MAFLLNFIKKIYIYRHIIRSMALQEIRKRYAGTLGGFVWSIIHPLMMILIFWFVFSIGFKIQPAGGVPFIVMFLCGLIPWITFSESLTASAGAITGNPHLVKKTLFPTEILPVVHLVSRLFSHGIMLLLLLVILVIYNRTLSIWNLQFLYYLFALSIFCLGCGWFFSAMNVFFRDVGQILGVVINLWFWVTPIVWQLDMLPPKYQYIIKLNPMYYIVDGYQVSFLYHVSFWQKPLWGIYFWLICLLSFVMGGVVFKKLKPEFAEVL